MPFKSNSKLTVEPALERFVLQLEANGRSPHTINQYRRHVRLLASWLSKKRQSTRIASIDHEDLALFLSSSTARRRPDGKPKKATAMNALRTSLRVFFSYSHQAGYISENPGRLIRRARCGTPPPRSLSDQEQERLLDALSRARGPEEERDRALLSLMLWTGIRLGSALHLEGGDVNLERGELHLRSAKGDRPDRLPINRKAHGLLARYLRGRDDGPLFSGRSGNRLTARQARRRFATWISRAGIKSPATLHALRHTFGQGLYERTGDIALVQRALLHGSIVSTLTYARADEARLRKALTG